MHVTESWVKKIIQGGVPQVSVLGANNFFIDLNADCFITSVLITKAVASHLSSLSSKAMWEFCHFCIDYINDHASF